MTKQTEALKLALETLTYGGAKPNGTCDVDNRAITAIREALADIGNPISAQPAQPQQEPVEVKQIAEALRQVGLTLVRTNGSFRVMDLGRIEAQTTSPPAQPQQEPVAWIPITEWRWNNDAGTWEGLTDTSPPAQRKPLTDEQRMEMWRTTKFRGNGGQIDWFIEGTRAAEAAHGIKGDA